VTGRHRASTLETALGLHKMAAEILREAHAAELAGDVTPEEYARVAESAMRVQVYLSELQTKGFLS